MINSRAVPALAVVRDESCCILEGETRMNFKVEIDQEDVGRWIADVPELPGVMAYGITRDDAVAKVQALALRILAERLDNGESGPQVNAVLDRKSTRLN